MKKINFIIILFISALFFFPDNVFAAESLGTCVYEFSGEEIGYYARARRFSLSVTVYDDGTTGNRLFSVYDSEGNVWSDEPSSGLLLGDHGIYLQYSEGIFNQNGVIKVNAQNIVHREFVRSNGTSFAIIQGNLTKNGLYSHAIIEIRNNIAYVTNIYSEEELAKL